MAGSMVDEFIPIELLNLPDNSTELIETKTRYIYSVRQKSDFNFGLVYTKHAARKEKR